MREGFPGVITGESNASRMKATRMIRPARAFLLRRRLWTRPSRRGERRGGDAAGGAFSGTRAAFRITTSPGSVADTEHSPFGSGRPHARVESDIDDVHDEVRHQSGRGD